MARPRFTANRVKLDEPDLQGELEVLREEGGPRRDRPREDGLHDEPEVFDEPEVLPVEGDP